MARARTIYAGRPKRHGIRSYAASGSKAADAPSALGHSGIPGGGRTTTGGSSGGGSSSGGGTPNPAGLSARRAAIAKHNFAKTAATVKTGAPGSKARDAANMLSAGAPQRAAARAAAARIGAGAKAVTPAARKLAAAPTVYRKQQRVANVVPWTFLPNLPRIPGLPALSPVTPVPKGKGPVKLAVSEDAKQLPSTLGKPLTFGPGSRAIVGPGGIKGGTDDNNTYSRQRDSRSRTSGRRVA